jgi:hypothetical protein
LGSESDGGRILTASPRHRLEISKTFQRVLQAGLHLYLSTKVTGVESKAGAEGDGRAGGQRKTNWTPM